MSARKPIAKSHKQSQRPPFECIALLLQGGGALGAYQAGVYEALHEAGIEPDWVAGISIGAVNAAIIAGNAPEKRIERLRDFWEHMTGNTWWDYAFSLLPSFQLGDTSRMGVNQLSSAAVATFGVPGFFMPRFVTPWLAESGSLAATSYYDTAPLRAMLEKLVDFDRVNHCKTRLSVGAVNIRSGNFVYFDTKTHTIRPEHILASGALPPGFPGVEVDGEFYWDGGLISNTPLQWVLQSHERQDTLAFQVDLWNARGTMPSNMAEVMTRQKEIMYSSRTRAATDQFKKTQRMRNLMAEALACLPKEVLHKPEIEEIRKYADDKAVYNIVHLIYHAREYETNAKDFDFSRQTMLEHWKSGYNDTVRSLRHPDVLERPSNKEGVMTFDVAHEGHE